MKIEHGTNTINGRTVIKDSIAEQSKKALQSEIRLPLTQSETLKLLGTEEEVRMIEQFEETVSKLDTLRMRVAEDRTRSAVERLYLFNQKSKPYIDNIRTTGNKLREYYINSQSSYESQKFSNNTELTQLDVAVLPQFVSVVSDDENTLSVGSLTEAEGRLMVSLMKSYPSVVSDNYDATSVSEELDRRFTPTAYAQSKVYAEALTNFDALSQSLVNSISNAMPQQLIETLKSKRVA